MNTSLKITQNDQGMINELISMNKILDTKSYEDFKKYFYKDDSKIMVCDGKQLAISEHEILKELGNGFYSFIKKSAKEYFLVKEDLEFKFPVIMSFVDTAHSYGKKTNFITDSKDTSIFPAQICKLILETGCSFNFEMVKNIKDLSPEWKVYYKDDKSPIMFETPDKLFHYIIMPIIKPD